MIELDWGSRIEEDWQERVSDLAADLVSEAMDRGEAFSEGLCNWAIGEAERRIPKPTVQQ